MIIWTYCLAIILVLASVESKNGDTDKKKIEHGKGKSHISKQINKYLNKQNNSLACSLLRCVSALRKNLPAPSSKIENTNNVKKQEDNNLKKKEANNNARTNDEVGKKGGKRKGKGKKKIQKKGKKKNLKKGKGKKDLVKNQKNEGEKKKQRKNKSINQGKDGKTKKSGKSHVKSEENLEKFLYRKPKSMEVFVES